MDSTVRPRFILPLLSLAQLVIVLDFSIVNVALPSIQAEFGLAPINLQWVWRTLRRVSKDIGSINAIITISASVY
jgi:hypothetical protein